MALPRDFYPNPVTDCKVLKTGKVYLLTLSDDSQVVIKAESQNFTITDRSEERKKMDFGFKLSAKLGDAVRRFGIARHAIEEALDLGGLAEDADP